MRDPFMLESEDQCIVCLKVRTKTSHTMAYLEALVRTSPVLLSLTSQSLRMQFFPDALTHVST